MNTGCEGVLLLCLGDQCIFPGLPAGETKKASPLEPFSGLVPAS